MTRPTHVFRGLWPILPGTPLELDALIDEASRQMPRMLGQARARRVEGVRPRWSIRPGRDVPGSGGARSVLIVDLPVTTYAADVDALTGQRDVEGSATTSAERAGITTERRAAS